MVESDYEKLGEVQGILSNDKCTKLEIRIILEDKQFEELFLKRGWQKCKSDE